MSDGKERLSIDEGAMAGESPVELETITEKMTAPDDTFEPDYDIVEVDRTPAFANDGKFALIKRAASVMSSEISLVNTIVGAGILSLPMAMYKFGLIIGIILVVVMGTLGFCGMWFLANAGDELYKRAQKKNNGKFPDINVCFTWVGNQISPVLAALLNVVLFVYLIGVLIAYLIVVADAFPVVCRSYIYDDESSSSSSGSGSSEGVSVSSDGEKEWYLRMLTKRWFWILVVSVIVWPLSYVKKLDALRYFSALMLPCVTYIIILLIVKASQKSSHVEFYPRSTSAFSALSVLMFAFSCHMNYYSVFQELGPRNRVHRANIAGGAATAIAAAIYILAGLFGYIYAGPDTKGNIINSLPGKSISSSIARIAIAINVVVAYPILLNPARAALTGLLELNPKINAINKNVVHVITTTVIFLLSLISMAVNSIDVVLGFCGCLGSSLTSFIFPGYFYFRVFREDPSKKTQIRLSIVFIVVGFIFLVAGFILQVLDVI